MEEKMRDIVIFVGAGLLVGVAWWHFYVVPSDEWRAAVIDCVLENNTDTLPIEAFRDKDAVDHCINKLRPGG